MVKAAQDQFVSCIPLPAMASSIATARLHTRVLLDKWHLLSVVDDAELVVSEIVTNAIKATNIIPPQARYPELYDRMEVVCLCFYQLAAELVIEVWDPKQEPPQRRNVTLDDEGGRGLFLVEALCKGWGVRWPQGGGKIVWASLALRAAHPGGSA